jgi:glycosyltransferase involved in cell wall biosynthesis
MSNIELTQRMPLVSVVMAVKNGGDYIRHSLNSVIYQTFSDFEIILINDGSEDNTLEIVESLNDSRIRIYSQKNRGVARSANRGLALARGKYIARIDHDDLWFPERLEKQVNYLEAHPEIALIGSAAVIWSSSAKSYDGRNLDHPTTYSSIKWELLFNNPFVHSSILFRKEIIKKVGLYYPGSDITPLDDYHFISRVASEFKVINLAERLVIYRETSQSLTSNFRETAGKKLNSLEYKLAKISGENLAKLNNLPVSNKTCINLSNTVNQIAPSTSFFNLLRMESLLLSSAEKISSLSPDASNNIESLLRFRINDLQSKWLKNLTHVRLMHKTLFSLRDIYFGLVSLQHPSKSTKNYGSLVFQSISTKYWNIREAIYHKLYIGRILGIIRKLSARVKK